MLRSLFEGLFCVISHLELIASVQEFAQSFNCKTMEGNEDDFLSGAKSLGLSFPEKGEL